MSAVKIDYEKEVRAVFPDAKCKGRFYIKTPKKIFGIAFSYKTIGQHIMTEFGAWVNAYHNLVKQGKITPKCPKE